MVRAIFIDALNTLFVPRDGKTRYELMQQIIFESAGAEVATSDLVRVYAEKRKELEDLPAESYAAKWIGINAAMLKALNIADANGALAREMNVRLLGDPDLYEVPFVSRLFLRRMQLRGIKVIVASNNDAEPLKKMLGAFGLTNLVWRAYSSQEIGYEKPTPEFFREILRWEELNASQCIMVGNNPRNDMQGCAQAGIRGVLYDPEWKHNDYAGDLRIWSLQAIGVEQDPSGNSQLVIEKVL